MKNMKKLLALALIIMSVFAIAAPALAASKMYVKVQGPGNTVNVRSSAGGSVIATLTHGSAVTADGTSGDYTKVSFYNPKTKVTLTGVYIQTTFLSSSIPSDTAWITYYGTVDYKLTTGTKYDGCKKLQHDLNTVLKLSLVEDGICGQNTVNAIKQFQGTYNLTQDGVAGNMTKEYLYKLTK